MSMTVDDLIVIGICAVIGYALVWFALSLRNRRRDDQRVSTHKIGRSKSKSDQTPDWYQVLEVSKTASIEEIRVAYHERSCNTIQIGLRRSVPNSSLWRKLGRGK